MDEFHEDKRKRKYGVMKNPYGPVKRDKFRAAYSNFEDILELRATKGQCVIEAMFFFEFFINW